jgi:hypothetical protein
MVDAVGKSLGYSSPQDSVPLAQGEVWKTILDQGGYVSTPTSGNALNCSSYSHMVISSTASPQSH